MDKARILLVDDDLLILKSVGADLKSRGFEVTTAENGHSAVEALEGHHFDLVITDLVMDEIDGIGVLKAAKERDPETMVILLTGYGDMASAIDALRLGADDYILKPCESEEMYFRIRGCLERLELARKIKLYESNLPVCCLCKKIRDDSHVAQGRGKWFSMEDYLHKKAKVDITSTYCPECARKQKEELDRVAGRSKQI